MVLTDGDKAECKEIAREIIREVMQEHIASCPHGLFMARSKSWIIGMSIGVGIGGGIGGGGIVYALIHSIVGIAS